MRLVVTVVDENVLPLVDRVVLHLLDAEITLHARMIAETVIEIENVTEIGTTMTVDALEVPPTVIVTGIET